MHPAPSVIIFSTLSGAGFGLLFFLGLDPDPPRGWVGFTFFAIAYALACGGLFSAFFHLKNKKNAWKSYSQWRTSWLSREAWAAVLALVVMGVFAAGLVFRDTHFAPLGWVGALLSLATVFTTSMIYAQLRAVPRWNQAATPAMFLAYALAGGALLSGRETWSGWLFLLAGAITLWHWWKGDRRFAEVGTTIRSATRLNSGVTLFEAPHTGDNYLTREMVFRIARKHAVKLRVIGLLAASLVPAILVLAPFDLGFAAKHALAGLALLIHLGGVFVTRWLFFAEAEHVVGLYYGAHLDRQAA
ncbi:dimethyl sulfoxide reductase anchor subunit family protein [Jannaschia aquimarina]|uniref:DMSO reductase anchor subunit (DmsC) n=1 Tax=Jannaschia aquimarina TaxID=935700 RepID=A0A0D1EE98_9RHOB|nr:DmsC/YnfH family molybdoenzyme membrane anchor subunit [Jannaschia aquimarina]KIT16024.1 DMSO reductase anchor subunit (DmsC) [Jannaschia aquimarina]SNT00330.1 DMSO reductase anchor subunit [Jannaschia aquimarina]